jgi:cytochrome c5
MTGKYLITTDRYFVAPDGKTYTAVWGDVKLVEDSILGVKTNRNSANWYAVVGGNGKEIIVAGCQIFYAIKCEEKPHTGDVEDWTVDNAKFESYTRPTKIYIAE